MHPTLTKLNYKAQPVAVVLNAPAEVRPVLDSLRETAEVITDVASLRPADFMLAFVKTQSEVDALTAQLTEALPGDGLLWFVYPKGTSKKHKCDFNRETGWAALGERGFEPVRQVAIDDDWSALRFRRVAFIKTMTRHPEGAISAAGREKAMR